MRHSLAPPLLEGLASLPEEGESPPIPIDCAACRSEQGLRLTLMRCPGHLRVIIASSDVPPAYSDHGAKSNQFGKVKAGRYVPVPPS